VSLVPWSLTRNENTGAASDSVVWTEAILELSGCEVVSIAVGSLSVAFCVTNVMEVSWVSLPAASSMAIRLMVYSVSGYKGFSGAIVMVREASSQIYCEA